jgi:hypothetical protein
VETIAGNRVPPIVGTAGSGRLLPRVERGLRGFTGRGERDRDPVLRHDRLQAKLIARRTASMTLVRPSRSPDHVECHPPVTAAALGRAQTVTADHVQAALPEVS